MAEENAPASWEQMVAQYEAARRLNAARRKPLSEALGGFGEGFHEDYENPDATRTVGVMDPENTPLRESAREVGRAISPFQWLPTPGAGMKLLAAGAGGAVKLGNKVETLLGKFPTTTAGRIVNKTAERGGYSVNLPSGEIPTEGLMMGRYRNDDPRNLVTDALTRAKVAEMVHTNREVLSRPDAYLGTWKDPATGTVYIDVPRRFEPDEIRKATKFGERTAQKEGYDVGKGETFPVGNWEKFISGPEFNRRMHELAGEGEQYLSQFPKDVPNQEWWDIPTLLRVYGEHRKPQISGFLASTAPNAAPRENTQTFSEYMRRLIKDEPIIQPDWRVPEGQMTRQAGTQIGMEESRAANLEKSAAGRLDELQADKVREEAAALMGDPNAQVFDRHWGRVAEDPASGVYTATGEGIVEPGKQYSQLKVPVATAAEESGKAPRNFSANVWTAIRERIKKTGNLFGQLFDKGKIQGESYGYDAHFKQLVEDKARHMGISVPELEKRLGAGDATLLKWFAATPLAAALLGGQDEETQ